MSAQFLYIYSSMLQIRICHGFTIALLLYCTRKALIHKNSNSITVCIIGTYLTLSYRSSKTEEALKYITGQSSLDLLSNTTVTMIMLVLGSRK